MQKQHKPAEEAPVEQPEVAPTQPTANPNVLAPLSDDEVKRRLRKLAEPATLFGEDADVRRARLAHAEATIVIQDEGARGGERENVLLRIAKEDRDRAQRGDANEAGKSGAVGGAAAGAGAASQGTSQVCARHTIT